MYNQFTNFNNTKEKVPFQQKSKVILALSFPCRREGFCTVPHPWGCGAMPGILMEISLCCTGAGRARTVKACATLDLHANLTNHHVSER